MPEVQDLLERLYRFFESYSVLNEAPGLKSDVKYLVQQCLQDFRTKGLHDHLMTIQAVLDITWEDLNTGHWSEVEETPKRIFALSSLMKVAAFLEKSLKSDDVGLLYKAVKAADMGLLLGYGYHEELTNAAQKISFILMDVRESRQSFEPGRSQGSTADESITHAIPVQTAPSLSRPSLVTFNLEHFTPQKPAKLTDCLTHWPALEKWTNIDYLETVAGPRTVPIELGSAYTQNDWGMKLSTFRDFIENHIKRKSDQVGYLAQHQLFDQIPELKKDIDIPDYCCLSEDDDSDCDVDINAWFGPAGTVTPLHYDPKHNFLCQVVGRKKIYLYSPEDSSFLYPHDGTMLHNTARVDPYSPDFVHFPKFKMASAYFCLLNPGDMLYIPPKWWHHVTSLDLSFSVSFWWK